MSAAASPLWLEDPSPSWDELAARAGVELELDGPEDADDFALEVGTAKLWPAVPPAAQEPRP